MDRDEVEQEFTISEERERLAERKMELAISINEPIEKVFYKDPFIVTEDTKIIEAINTFNKKDIGCVLVVDKETGKITGIFTERDVIRKLLNGKHDLNNEHVGQYMTRNPDTFRLEDPIAFALNRFAACGYRHIPLVDENNIPVGVISIKDIIEHLADFYSSEVLNLPPSPHAKQKTQEGG